MEDMETVGLLRVRVIMGSCQLGVNGYTFPFTSGITLDVWIGDGVSSIKQHERRPQIYRLDPSFYTHFHKKKRDLKNV